MSGKYTNWKSPENEERLRVAAASNVSIAGMLRSLGLADHGGNVRTVRHHIVRLNIDTSHHTGQAWNRDNYKGADKVTHKAALKANLINENFSNRSGIRKARNRCAGEK